MFNTNQIDMLNAVLSAYTDELVGGRIHYIAYTTNTSDNDPDLYVVVTNGSVTTSDGYTFYFDDDVYTLISCYTSNYYNGNGYNGKRVVSSTVASKILTINNREFVSSNVSSEVFCCLDYSDRGVIQSVKNNQVSFAFTGLVCCIFIYLCITHFFDLWQRRR